MTICLDLDGVIAEGRHVNRPDDPTVAYMALLPLDSATVEVYNRLCRLHTVVIITSRHHSREALREIGCWLEINRLAQPHSIVTHVEPAAKGEICRALGADFFFDDSPTAYQEALAVDVNAYLMNNPGWAENQAHQTKRRVRDWRHLEWLVEGS